LEAVTMERGTLRKVEVDEPIPKKGEVLVKSIACGICGSDLHAAKHTEDFVKTSRESGGAFKLTTFSPVILGHEFCAEIVDYGPNTEKSLSPGTLVCAAPVLLRDPFLSIGFSEKTPGGFSQYMLLSESVMQPVPSGVRAEEAALTEPVAVALHAINKARLEGNEEIVVIGCGPVGLAILTILKSSFKGQIIASDFSPQRRSLAEKVGAHQVVNPQETSPFSSKFFRENKKTVVFECVGVPGVIDDIILEAPQNSKLVVVGVCLQKDSFRPLIAINKEISMQFVLGWSMEEFSESLNKIASGEINASALITKQITLDQVSETFKELSSPNADAKVLVKPWM
jgi:2-desacetyl-2-hydroxyethyl bacteriochlorophyllide A dehydrogenase